MQSHLPSAALIVAILTMCGSACRSLTAEPEGVPRSWDEVREAGRAKSRFLNDAKTFPESTSSIPTADLAQFQKSIGPVLAQKCAACHGPNSTKANLRVDKLNPDLLAGPDIDRWRGIYKVLGNSEMPPEDQPKYRLADADRTNIVNWLGQELSKASVVRRNRSENSSFRRMTNYEYNYALQDLFGLPYPIANSLPPETASVDGFKNSSDLLQMSSMQFEAYREFGLSPAASNRQRRTSTAGHVHHFAARRDGQSGGQKGQTEHIQPNRQKLSHLPGQTVYPVAIHRGENRFGPLSA
jgi:mono/diheme cytochrome c family protein